MARARNIKPGFFTNDLISEMSPWARLTFIGLWTLADKAGRMLYRPKKIKMELFPGDTIDVEPLIDELIAHGFVEVYETDGITVLAVINFSKHQNPHPKERDSELPPKKPGTSTIREKSRQAAERSFLSAENPERAGLIPDIRIPDSGSLIGDIPRSRNGADEPEKPKPPKKPKRATQVSDDFEVTEELVQWASKSEEKFTVSEMESQVPRFIAHHKAKGTTYKDWHAGFQNWMRNALDFGHLNRTPDGTLRDVSRGRGGKRDVQSQNDAAFAQVARENGWDTDPDDDAIETNYRRTS